MTDPAAIDVTRIQVFHKIEMAAAAQPWIERRRPMG
jgi:hypothetical protein